MSTDMLVSHGPPPVTLANFVEYAKAKHEVFSLDDGEKRKEIHVAFCDGRSGTVFFATYLEFLLMYIQYVLSGGTG